MNKIFILLGFILLVFAAILLFQATTKPMQNPYGKAANSKVTINSVSFQVELAKTPKEQIKGLSGRKNLPQSSGMLFLFDRPSYRSFWMAGMKFPLDMIFIANDKVVAVYENLPPASPNDENPPQYGSDVISDKVLEINAGDAKKNNIKVDDAVIIEKK